MSKKALHADDVEAILADIEANGKQHGLNFGINYSITQLRDEAGRAYAKSEDKRALALRDAAAYLSTLSQALNGNLNDKAEAGFTKLVNAKVVVVE